MHQSKQAILFLVVAGGLCAFALIRLPGLIRYNANATDRLLSKAQRLAGEPQPVAENSAPTGVATSEAYDQLQSFLTKKPLELDGHLLLARLEKRMGRMSQSWHALNRAALARPFDTRPPYLLGMLQLENGMLKEGLLSFSRSLYLGPDQLPQIFSYCHTIFAGRYERFQFIFPDHPALSEELGNLLRDAGMVRQGIEAYQKASLQIPGEARLLEKIANGYAKLGEFGKALNSIERAIDLIPSSPRFTCRKAGYLLGLGDSEQSIALCRALLAADPEYAEAYRLLARCYASRGETTNEIQTIKSALQRVDRKSRFHQLLGNCYSGADRHSDALRQFELGLETATNDEERKYALYGIGRCLLDLDRPTEALSTLEKAQAISLPGNDKPGKLVDSLIEKIR